MKNFTVGQIDIAVARKEYDDFKQKIESKTDLKEREDILSFLRDAKQLPFLIPSFLWQDWDLYAREKPIVDDFVTDLVVGKSKETKFILIEFENANKDSIFVQRKRNLKYWGDRFNDALGQITDWFWRIDELTEYEKRKFFKIDSINYLDYEGLIIIGRDSYFDDEDDQRRLFWRARCTLINSRPFRVMTYDTLLNKMGETLQTFENIKLIKEEQDS
ncbi:hypothetical protein COK41_14920 [Bacillus cereus]|nr:hypothetical protein COK41_14920 [Bacillus cereus]